MTIDWEKKEAAINIGDCRNTISMSIVLPNKTDLLGHWMMAPLIAYCLFELYKE
jgi:hypothetical protein